MKKTISCLMIYALMFIALRVALGLSYHENMWRWIVSYWVTLTLKNLIDFGFSMIEKE